MARQHHYRRRTRDPADLDMTTFLNLMVALIPFLLVTAVFSRITIVELDLPSAANATTPGEPVFRLEVIVRKQGFELTNGNALIATIPKLDEQYDLKTLAELVLSLKQDHPDADDASVLLEPDIEYDHLIQVMDVVRSAEVPAAGGPQAGGPDAGDGTSGDREAGGREATRVALFTDIAVGDAP
jgi:biopolymer transport protein ExbD